LQTGADVQKEADRILLARYVPPSVLVNADLEILRFRGDTGPYLAPAPGKASLSLLRMARPGLTAALRAAIGKARKEAAPVREEGLQLDSGGGAREVHLEVVPVRGSPAGEGGFLILFEEPASTSPPPGTGSEPGARPWDPGPGPPRGRRRPRARTPVWRRSWPPPANTSNR